MHCQAPASNAAVEAARPGAEGKGAVAVGVGRRVDEIVIRVQRVSNLPSQTTDAPMEQSDGPEQKTATACSQPR